MYETAKIREYNQKRGIKSNMPVNKRNRKKKKRGRSIKVDKEEYKEKYSRKVFWLDKVMQESISEIRNQRDIIFGSYNVSSDNEIT